MCSGRALKAEDVSRRCRVRIDGYQFESVTVSVMHRIPKKSEDIIVVN
jgi:hypothetical protein